MGSNIHQSQFKYEFATSDFNCAFAETTEKPKYFFISLINLFINI